MKKIIILLFLITCFLLLNTNEDKQVIIPKESIRLRIIGNSNQDNDQALKMNIKKEIEPFLLNIQNNSSNIIESRKIILENIPLIEAILKEKGLEHQINYGQNYFPEKLYKGITYEKGNYESLIIKLGQGLGDNWWCVLFPPLCLIEADKTELNQIEYSFYIKNIIDKFY